MKKETRYREGDTRVREEERKQNYEEKGNAAKGKMNGGGKRRATKRKDNKTTENKEGFSVCNPMVERVREGLWEEGLRKRMKEGREGGG